MTLPLTFLNVHNASSFGVETGRKWDVGEHRRGLLESARSSVAVGVSYIAL